MLDIESASEANENDLKGLEGKLKYLNIKSEESEAVQLDSKNGKLK